MTAFEIFENLVPRGGAGYRLGLDMTDSDNRRRFDRFFTSDVQGRFSYAVEARVLNISLGGFAVRTGTQLTVGREYRFQLGKKAEAMNLSGLVRWCKMAGTEKCETGDVIPVYEAGIAFNSVLTEQADHLREFMEKSIIIDVRRRIFGRFRAQDPKPVTLESDSRFVVKQISQAGVLVESSILVNRDEVIDLELILGQRKFVSPSRVAHVAEIEAEEADRRYHLGLEFVDTQPRYRDVLEKFVRLELETG